MLQYRFRDVRALVVVGEYASGRNPLYSLELGEARSPLMLELGCDPSDLAEAASILKNYSIESEFIIAAFLEDKAGNKEFTLAKAFYEKTSSGIEVGSRPIEELIAPKRA